MFDFFRDIILEASGIDPVAAAEVRSERKKAKKMERYIFSRGAKIIVFVFGVLYLVITWFSMKVMKDSGTLSALYLIRYIFLIACDIASLVCLAIGKKKAEVAALVLIVVFVVTQYFTVLFI